MTEADEGISVTDTRYRSGFNQMVQSFLGYRKGEDVQMEIVPEEAETVRFIYRLFMQGQTPYMYFPYIVK